MRNKKGFTVIELIVVVSIIGILAAIGVPAYLDSNRKAEAKRCDEYAGSFYMALQQTLTPYISLDGTTQELKYTMLGGALEKTRTDIRIDPAYANSYFFLYAEVGDSARIDWLDIYLYLPDPTASPPLTAQQRYTDEVHNLAMTPGARSAETFANCAIRINLKDPSVEADANRELADKIKGALESYLKISKGDKGYYYAMFDPDFRVTMTYYSKNANWVGASNGTNTVFVKDNTLSVSITDTTDTHVFGAYPTEYSKTQTPSFPNIQRRWFETVPNV